MKDFSYVDPIKAASRDLLWSKAINALTTGRAASRVLAREKYEEGWEYCSSIFERYTNVKLDVHKLNDWLDFAEDRYGSPKPSDLRVAYLSGPEPENDMRVLVGAGVRIENVWAIEEDAGAHAAALQRAREMFPTLKIYEGGFDTFVRVARERFDIVYLDFTAPMWSAAARPYSTVHSMFDEQVLADLGVAIINCAEPLKNDEAVDFLVSYFSQQPYIESAALGHGDDEDENSIWYSEVAPDEWESETKLRQMIAGRMHNFYSNFLTQYPAMYANRVQPSLRILRVADARRGLFAKDTSIYKTATSAAADADAVLAMFQDRNIPTRENGFGPGMDFLLSPSDYPLWWFIERLSEFSDNSNACRKWRAEFEQKLLAIDSHPFKPARIDAVRLSDLLWHIAEGYFPLASDRLLEGIVGSLRQFIGRKEGLFCDTPMMHLLSQLALNQLGYPHHPNQGAHWRASYVAKRTEMFLDVHVLDRCRPLYDRLPAVSLYPEFFSDFDQQMIARIGMSLIEAQAHGVVPRLYWGSSLEGRYDSDWERWAHPRSREVITVS